MRGGGISRIVSHASVARCSLRPAPSLQHKAISKRPPDSGCSELGNQYHRRPCVHARGPDQDFLLPIDTKPTHLTKLFESGNEFPGQQLPWKSSSPGNAPALPEGYLRACAHACQTSMHMCRDSHSGSFGGMLRMITGPATQQRGKTSRGLTGILKDRRVRIGVGRGRTRAVDKKYKG